MTKKALVIVQGINNKREYMKPKSKVVKEFFSRYDEVDYMYTEDIFDGSLTSKFIDKADFIPYFFSNKRRQMVCRLVNEKIKTLEHLGYEVDVVAHSLGSVIALQSGRKVMPIMVNKMITLQSPIHNWIYGWFVRGRVRKYSDGLTIRHYITTWNKKDRLVAGGDLNIKRFVKGLKSTILSFFQFEVGKGHDWEVALKDLIIKGLV